MRELILVVDDERYVLNIVCSILRHAGYDVVPAASPDEALRLGAAIDRPIDLLLSDVLMPGMSGPALAERFAGLHPETQCLFIAGLPDSPEVSDHILARGRAFLPKPFMPKTLVDKVQEVIDSSPALS